MSTKRSSILAIAALGVAVLITTATPAVAADVVIRLKCKNGNPGEVVKASGRVDFFNSSTPDVVLAGFGARCSKPSTRPSSPTQRTRGISIPEGADSWLIQLRMGLTGTGKTKCDSPGTFPPGTAPVFNEACQVSQSLVRIRTL